MSNQRITAEGTLCACVSAVQVPVMCVDQLRQLVMMAVAECLKYTGDICYYKPGRKGPCPPWPEAHGATPRRIRCGDTAREGLAWLVFAQRWAFTRRASYLACCRPSGGAMLCSCTTSQLHPEARQRSCAVEPKQGESKQNAAG